MRQNLRDTKEVAYSESFGRCIIRESFCLPTEGFSLSSVAIIL